MGGPLDGKMTSNTVDFVHDDGTRYMFTDFGTPVSYRVFFAADLMPQEDVMPRLLSAYRQRTSPDGADEA